MCTLLVLPCVLPSPLHAYRHTTAVPLCVRSHCTCSHSIKDEDRVLTAAFQALSLCPLAVKSGPLRKRVLTCLRVLKAEVPELPPQVKIHAPSALVVLLRRQLELHAFACCWECLTPLLHAVGSVSRLSCMLLGVSHASLGVCHRSRGRRE